MSRTDPWAEELIYAPSKGIGGWLYLPLLHLIALPLLVATSVMAQTKAMMDPAAKAALSGHPAFLALMVVLDVAAVVRAVFGIACLVQLFRKRLQLPRMMTIWYGMGIALAVLGVVLYALFPLAFTQVVNPAATPGTVGRMATISLVFSAIFIVYFDVSGRVKRTFERGNPEYGIWRALWAPADPNREPEGIRGWLLLPLLQLLVDPISSLLYVATQMLHHKPLPPGHAISADLTLAGLVLIVALIALGLYCLVRFLKKDRRLPALMIGWYGVAILGQIDILAMAFVDHTAFAAAAGGKPVPVIVRAVITMILSGVLIAYFRRSRRVRNTFTR